MLDVSFGRLLDALTTLDAFKDLLRSTSKTFRRRICQPIISRSSEGVTCTIDETSNRLSVSFISKNKDARGVLDCLSLTFFFLNTKFPRRLGSAIGTTLIEDLVDILICDWLNPSISLDLSDLTESYDIQKKVDELAEQLSSYGWPGHKSLRSWIERLPQTWLEKRRTSSLDAVRRVLKAPRGPNREVQRIEREHVSTEDQVFQNDKLNGGIAGQAGEDNRELAAPTDVSQKEEDDLSGWGFDADGENDDGTAQSPTIANDDARDSIDLEGRTDNGADNTHPDGSKAPTGRADAPPLNGSTEHQEVTLTETYLITDIPDYLLDIISREVQDAEQVKESKYAALESISASADLLSLPTLILAMFRATAPPYYTSTLLNGNMHLYNDCMFMAEKLGDLAKTASLTELRQGCHVLQKFARSAYAREMDTQRTILGDLLDGAQGFVSCTRFPYSTECENAVNSTIDRLRAVHQDWKAILSHSALLQSIGSLLSTVIEKILKDIEDMEDISEAESQRLAAFCGRFSSLEDLFMSQRLESTEKAGAEVVPLTAVYVSNWLRFQYLTNVLESSLADIKYLWTEGELSLEFNVDEVIDLIEALFADSSHRRNAIAEIRRSRQ